MGLWGELKMGMFQSALPKTFAGIEGGLEMWVVVSERALARHR